MKVLFLDFDGVLNSEKYIRRTGLTGVVIDPVNMALLKQIIDATDARIVLSTTWREHWSQNPDECNSTGREINEIFAEYGLQIFDKTPMIYPKRETEIQSWLESHPGVESFVVLDDRFLSADYLTGHFVKTSGYARGLDETDMQTAIKILNG
ncbi:MAG: hypothetical protein E7448_01640 [Ruminococcaceae bacterium]|nr:hypothetical protein [Oscillospiraceae bacterium]